MIFDYTEKVCALLTDELRDWRPVDPSGRFIFSLGEIVAHCADARRLFARQLSGYAADDNWTDGPGEAGTWPLLRPLGTIAELRASLGSAREELNAFLQLPAAEQWTVTEPARASFERNLQQLREKNLDTTEMEARGPANINRVLFGCACHESGHRGSLQGFLRLHGIGLLDNN